MLGNLRSIIEGLLRSMVLNEWGVGVGSGVSQRGGLVWSFRRKKKCCTTTTYGFEKKISAVKYQISLFSFLNPSERGFSLYRLM